MLKPSVPKKDSFSNSFIHTSMPNSSFDDSPRYCLIRHLFSYEEEEERGKVLCKPPLIQIKFIISIHLSVYGGGILVHTTNTTMDVLYQTQSHQLVIFLIGKPNRLFHNFRALRSRYLRILCSSETSWADFEAPKL